MVQQDEGDELDDVDKLVPASANTSPKMGSVSACAGLLDCFCVVVVVELLESELDEATDEDEVDECDEAVEEVEDFLRTDEQLAAELLDV